MSCCLSLGFKIASDKCSCSQHVFQIWTIFSYNIVNKVSYKDKRGSERLKKT